MILNKRLTNTGRGLGSKAPLALAQKAAGSVHTYVSQFTATQLLKAALIYIYTGPKSTAVHVRVEGHDQEGQSWLFSHSGPRYAEIFHVFFILKAVFVSHPKMHFTYTALSIQSPYISHWARAGEGTRGVCAFSPFLTGLQARDCSQSTFIYVCKKSKGDILYNHDTQALSLLEYTYLSLCRTCAHTHAHTRTHLWSQTNPGSLQNPSGSHGDRNMSMSRGY